MGVRYVFKKITILLFTFFILFTTMGTATSSIVYAAVEDTAITSKMYGSQYKETLPFDIESCAIEYAKFSDKVKSVQLSEYKTADEEGPGGLTGKFMDMLVYTIFSFGQGVSNLLFGSACLIGIAPSQLLGLMFFPVVLDGMDFLDTISVAVRTISILVLAVITVLSIYELNRKDGTIGEEIISKVGKFLLAAFVIAFSTFILQGIYDIANSLSYYISHYTLSINVTGPDSGGDSKPERLAVNLLNFPVLFVTYLEFAFSPGGLKNGFVDGLATLTLTPMVVALMSIVKIIVMVFMTKDLLQLAVYGLKRMITMVAASVLIPILAGLIPSNKTAGIFNSYFKNVLGSAFTPVLFGLIYLASAPFVIEDLVNMIEAPLLKVLVLAFYLNILVAIPSYVDGLIGGNSTLGNGDFSSNTGDSFAKHGRGYLKTHQAMNRRQDSNGNRMKSGLVNSAGAYTKKTVSSKIYGRKRK